MARFILLIILSNMAVQLSLSTPNILSPPFRNEKSSDRMIYFFYKPLELSKEAAEYELLQHKIWQPVISLQLLTYKTMRKNIELKSLKIYTFPNFTCSSWKKLMFDGVSIKMHEDFPIENVPSGPWCLHAEKCSTYQETSCKVSDGTLTLVPRSYTIQKVLVPSGYKVTLDWVHPLVMAENQCISEDSFVFSVLYLSPVVHY